jgi:hypothetical protein
MTESSKFLSFLDVGLPTPSAARRTSQQLPVNTLGCMRTHRVSSARSRSASSAGLEATRASSSCPCPTPPCLRLPALQRAHTTLPAAEEAAKAAWQQRRQWPEAELLAGVRGCLRVEMGLFVSLLAPAAPPRVARLQAEGRVAATAQLQEPVPTKRRTQHRLASPARSPARTARRLRAARGRVELPREPGGVKKTKHSPAPASRPQLAATRCCEKPETAFTSLLAYLGVQKAQLGQSSSSGTT